MNSHMSSLQSFLLLAPEIALVAAALVAFLGGAFAGLRSGWAVAFLGIVAALFVAGGQPAEGAWVASGGIRIDAFSTYIRWIVLSLGALLALVQAGDLFRSAATRGGFGGGAMGDDGTCEEAGTFLILLAGLSLAGVADDLVLLFVGLELVSIPTYILLSLKRTDAHGQEASLKYFFLSLVASSLFLYAAVCLYGIGGSTSLSIIGARLRSTAEAAVGMSTVLLPVAIGMTMAGAAFRLAAVPMHFYAPDVYEGTSPSNAALLSTLPKVAGVVVLVRVLSLAILPAAADATDVGAAAGAHLSLFWPLAAALAAVTMTVGNVMALLQRNLRRLLACSSIAHAGYLLVGVAAAAAAAAAKTGATGRAAADTSWTTGLGGLSATLFYLATYALATIGLFAAITYLGHRWPEWTAGSGPRPPREEITAVDDLDGLSSTNPVAAFAIALFLLSLAGIPPLPGFWGKLSLATSALEVDWNAAIVSGSRRAWFVGLAVVLVLNAAIAAAYYLRIIAAMYFRTTRRGVQADGGLAAGVAMLLCTALVLMVTLQPRGLFVSSSRAGDVIEKSGR
ncbi:MAG: NADH-quinone oxidoreductase subunit N [Planctomycetia bacterium]